jgi:regulator of cell morphogenesis and NO signaling
MEINPMNSTTTHNPETTVGQLVAEQPARSRVFEKLGIDYCCGGKIPLSDACARKNLDAATVLAMLDAAESKDTIDNGPDLTSMSMAQLCDHIVETHHNFLSTELPRIEFLTQKVAKTHGESWPWTVEVAEVFQALKNELTMHMMKEEHVLFPAIRDLEAGLAPQPSCANQLHGPISVMEDEHQSAGRALEKLNSLTSGYRAPEGACNTFRAMLDALATLESDLHQHIHKENNILFPRAMESFCT